MADYGVRAGTEELELQSLVSRNGLAGRRTVGPGIQDILRHGVPRTLLKKVVFGSRNLVFVTRFGFL